MEGAAPVGDGHHLESGGRVVELRGLGHGLGEGKGLAGGVDGDLHPLADEARVEVGVLDLGEVFGLEGEPRLEGGGEGSEEALVLAGLEVLEHPGDSGLEALELRVEGQELRAPLGASGLRDGAHAGCAGHHASGAVARDDGRADDEGARLGVHHHGLEGGVPGQHHGAGDPVGHDAGTEPRGVVLGRDPGVDRDAEVLHQVGLPARSGPRGVETRDGGVAPVVVVLERESGRQELLGQDARVTEAHLVVVATRLAEDEVGVLPGLEAGVGLGRVAVPKELLELLGGHSAQRRAGALLREDVDRGLLPVGGRGTVGGGGTGLGDELCHDHGVLSFQVSASSTGQRVTVRSWTLMRRQ